MSGTLRGFGVAAGVGAAIYGGYLLVVLPFSFVTLLLVVGCVLAGWFWIVALHAFAQMYDWIEHLVNSR